MLLVYLDYLLSKLILRKVIDKATFQQFSGESFEAAHRLLSEVLMLAAERERYAEFRTDFMWAVSLSLLQKTDPTMWRTC